MPLIEVGKKATVFKLQDQSGVVRGLKEYAGSPLVLYFYPKDDTSACTAEACDFRDAVPAFRKAKTVVLGISPDDTKSHAKFVKKYDIALTLLADVPNQGGMPKVCNEYGVWQKKSMYGRVYMGVVRTTYLIDASGRVAQRWDKVRVRGHVGEVIEAVKLL